MMKKNILFRIHSLGGGGGEKSLITLLKYLDYSKYRIDLLLDCKSGVYINNLPTGVNLFYLGNGNEFLLRIPLLLFIQKAWRKIKINIYNTFPYLIYKYKLKNRTYDVEIDYIFDAGPQIVKSPLSSKKIAWIHTDLRGERCKKIRKQMLRYLSKIDAIIPVSKQCKNVLISLFPDLESKIHVIYNGIITEEVIHRSKEVEIKKKRDRLQLVAVGRLVYPKGFDRLINVCYILKKEGIIFEFSILGKGPDRKKLVDQVRVLQLKDTIKFLGYQINPYPYISAADVFVMSSRYEGMSYVVLEALILNKPIVSTDITGVRELLKDGELGLLVENSEEGIYKGLKKIITDQTLRESFIQKDKNFSAFNPENIARQVENIIDTL